jgi:hypothetical protein
MGAWPSILSNWGSTEVCKSIQAFMAGVPIIAMRDAETWHRFRSRFPYPVQTSGIWFNAYVVARVMFGEKVFRSFFLDRMKAKYWNEDINAMLKSSAMREVAEICMKLRVVDPQTFIDKYLSGADKELPDAEVQQLLPKMTDRTPPADVPKAKVDAIEIKEWTAPSIECEIVTQTSEMNAHALDLLKSAEGMLQGYPDILLSLQGIQLTLNNYTKNTP